MDVIEREGIKVPNAVIVSGLTNTKVDEEIYEFLKQFGSIDRIIKVSDQKSELYGKALVEYASGAAVETLEKDLPYDRPSDSDKNVVFHIEALASVYSSEKGTDLTKTFLSDLQNIAKLSGKSFEHLLHDELSRITGLIKVQSDTVVPQDSAVGSAETATGPISPDATPIDSGTDGQNLSLDPPNLTFRPPENALPTQVGSVTSFFPSAENLNPPEVQRVVVEHIVKSSDLSSQIHAPVKLRPFSGKVPCPNFEVDYDTWRNSIECHLADPTVSSAQLVRRIVDSLLPPAATVVKSLGPHANPTAFLDLLDSAYATVEDGDELFAQFLSVNQNSGEKPSNYLQRLQTLLNRIVKMKTISSQDSDKQLLKQFCRGCWNNVLINNLQLERRKDNPPTFPEFLLLLRTEEDKQTAKANRMKQHLGFQKPKAQAAAQVHEAFLEDTYESPQSFSSQPQAMKQLQKQIVELQAQITALSSPKPQVSAANKPAKKKEKDIKYKEKSANKKTTPPKLTSEATTETVKPKPKPWYCFRCGEDGHIATSCNDPPNPTLVSAKRTLLKEKQQAWEKDNPTPDKHLN